MKSTVLVVGQMPDPHISAVAAELADLGADVILFNRLQAEDAALLYRFEGEAYEGQIRVGGKTWDLGAVTSVWWRVKPFTQLEVTGQPAPPAVGFAQREWRSMLDSLETFTPHARWVNARTADLAARNKPAQLAVARRLGLVVPPTLIANDVAAVEEFLAPGDGEYIYKALTWYFDPPDRIIFTSAVDRGQVSADPPAIQAAPSIFQARIAKAYEVRATVIGDAVFTVRIDSQAHQETRLDWRRNQAALTYVAWELPGEIEARLLAMNKRLGLDYGAYDLIVTPSGEHVFLEVNPLGQWLWLERAAGLPMARALATVLATGLTAGRECSQESRVPAAHQAPSSTCGPGFAVGSPQLV